MRKFIDFLHDVFENFGDITSRKMFGGYGIYHQGIMFGLVADDTLYLKADKDTQHKFESIGLMPFQYQKGDKTFSLSYYLAPDEIYDDKDQASKWAELAFNTAKAAKKPKNIKTKTSKKKPPSI